MEDPVLRTKIKKIIKKKYALPSDERKEVNKINEKTSSIDI